MGDGVGTLRAAIEEANASPEADTIEFAPGILPATILLQSPLPDISTPLTLNGPGAHDQIVDGRQVTTHVDNDIGIGGLWICNGTASLVNTVLAGNGPGANSDCGAGEAGSVVSFGHNLVGADSSDPCGLVDGVNGDRVGTPESPLDPLLAPFGRQWRPDAHPSAAVE